MHTCVTRSQWVKQVFRWYVTTGEHFFVQHLDHHSNQRSVFPVIAPNYRLDNTLGAFFVYIKRYTYNMIYKSKSTLHIEHNNQYTGFSFKLVFRYFIISASYTHFHIFSPPEVICAQFNASLSAAYMRQWTGSALVQIMACRLFDAKPLSKSMLGYYQFDA